VTPGVQTVLSFKDPNGTSVDIFAETSFTNEDKSPSAFIPHKLGHVAFNTAQISKLVSFYESVLGFLNGRLVRTCFPLARMAFLY
jgi:hypothetical protein